MICKWKRMLCVVVFFLVLQGTDFQLCIFVVWIGDWETLLIDMWLALQFENQHLIAIIAFLLSKLTIKLATKRAKIKHTSVAGPIGSCLDWLTFWVWRFQAKSTAWTLFNSFICSLYEARFGIGCFQWKLALFIAQDLTSFETSRKMCYLKLFNFNSIKPFIHRQNRQKKIVSIHI